MRYIRPATIKKHCFIIMLVVVLGFFFVGSLPAAYIPKTAKSKSTDTEVQVPENMTPEEVDAFLAGISDEKTRQILARKLKQEAAGN